MISQYRRHEVRFIVFFMALHLAKSSRNISTVHRSDGPQVKRAKIIVSGNDMRDGMGCIVVPSVIRRPRGLFGYAGLLRERLAC